MAASEAVTAPEGGLPLARRAKGLLAAVAFAAVAAALPALFALSVDAGDLLAFALLAAAAAATQVLVVETGKNHGFELAIAFLVAGALLLPAGLVALLALAQHAPDIVRGKYPRYIRVFNMSNFTLNGLAASVAANAVADPAGASGLRWAAAGLTACVVLVTLNHALLAAMLQLARGHGVRESGLFSLESLTIDLVLGGVGVAIAALSSENAVLVAAVVAPLLFAHRLFRLMAAASVTPAAGR